MIVEFISFFFEVFFLVTVDGFLFTGPGRAAFSGKATRLTLITDDRGGFFADLTGIGVDWRAALLVPLLAVITALIISALIIALSTLDLLRLWGESPVRLCKTSLTIMAAQEQAQLEVMKKQAELDKAKIKLDADHGEKAAEVIAADEQRGIAVLAWYDPRRWRNWMSSLPERCSWGIIRSGTSRGRPPAACGCPCSRERRSTTPTPWSDRFRSTSCSGAPRSGTTVERCYCTSTHTRR